MTRTGTLVLCALLLLGRGYAQDKIIIESRSTGKNNDKYKEISGKWIDSNTSFTAKSTAPGLTPGDLCGSRKHLPTNKEASNVRFSPKLTAPGHYFVYVTWPRAANAADLTYLIRHAGGEQKKVLSQSGWGGASPANSNMWIPLGDYDFGVGEDQGVELQVPADLKAADEKQLVQVFSDAVVFSPQALTDLGSPAEKPAASAKKVDNGVIAPIPGTIIVESRPEGKNAANYKEVEGAWMASAGKSHAPGLSDSGTVGTRKALCNGGTENLSRPATAAARFSPKLSAPGHAYVYVTWPREANAAPVTYTIKNAKGSETKTLKQDGWGAGGPANGGMWVPLGEFDFNPGDDQYVEVRNTGPDVFGVHKGAIAAVFADAVEFSPTPLQDTGLVSIDGARGKQSASSGAPPTPKAPVAASSGSVRSLQWETDIEKAMAQAGQQNKRILVFFFSPESATSRDYDSNVFISQPVKDLLGGGFVCVRLNFVENTDLAYKLGIFKAGTIVIYDAKGTPLDKIEGRSTAEQFASRLKTIK